METPKNFQIGENVTYLRIKNKDKRITYTCTILDGPLEQYLMINYLGKEMKRFRKWTKGQVYWKVAPVNTKIRQWINQKHLFLLNSVRSSERLIKKENKIKL